MTYIILSKALISENILDALSHVLHKEHIRDKIMIAINK
jgi:predicted RNA binding protein with dsRBD fold (UPF0201 family)